MATRGTGDAAVSEPYGGPGGGAERADGARTRLNIVLWVIALLCAIAVIVLAATMWSKHSSDEGGFGTRLGHTLVDKRAAPVVDFGKDVGKGVVTAQPASQPGDQQRIADVVETSAKMVDAFVNIDWRRTDSQFATVRSMATGDFQKQYDKSTKSIAKLSQRVHSVETGEVVWAAYVAGDAKTADTIVAVNGTVSSTLTKNEAVTKNLRLKVDLKKIDGRWLVDNVQFVS